MGLFKNMAGEPVSRLALREPVTVRPGSKVRDAVVAMRKQRLGCAIVIDGEQMPVGMFTESMLTQLVVHDIAAMEEPVEKHAAETWPWVKLTDRIVEVLDAMQLKNVRFICVVDDDGRLSGLTGQKGLMEYVAEHFPGEVMVQRIGGAPYPHQREGA